MKSAYRALVLRSTLALILAATSLSAAQEKVESGQNRTQLVRQMQVLEKAVSSTLAQMFQVHAFYILEEPKSAYLEGFGVVVHTQINLYPTTVLAPFLSSEALQQELKDAREQKPLRLKQLKARLCDLLASQSPSLTELGAGDNVAIIVDLFNPHAQSDIPNQVVIQARRQALLDLQTQSGKPSSEQLAKVVSFRSF